MPFSISDISRRLEFGFAAAGGAAAAVVVVVGVVVGCSSSVAGADAGSGVLLADSSSDMANMDGLTAWEETEDK